MLKIALFLLLAASCTSKKNTSDLVVCTNSTYPPYESIGTDGKAEGFDIDVAQKIANELKRKLVLKELSFDALILSLKQNKCDMVMAGMSITPSRQKEITMIPYQGEPSKSYTLLFWNKAPAITTVADVNNIGNKTVAVQVATWMEDYLKTVPGITVKPLEATTELVMEIQHGKSAAAFVEPHVAKQLLAKLPKIQVVEVKLPESEWKLGNGIGLNKSNTSLIQQVQDIVLKLKTENTLQQLEQKWFKTK